MRTMCFVTAIEDILLRLSESSTESCPRILQVPAQNLMKTVISNAYLYRLGTRQVPYPSHLPSPISTLLPLPTQYEPATSQPSPQKQHQPHHNANHMHPRRPRRRQRYDLHCSKQEIHTASPQHRRSSPRGGAEPRESLCRAYQVQPSPRTSWTNGDNDEDYSGCYDSNYKGR